MSRQLRLLVRDDTGTDKKDDIIRPDTVLLPERRADGGAFRRFEDCVKVNDIMHNHGIYSPLLKLSMVSRVNRPVVKVRHRRRIVILKYLPGEITSRREFIGTFTQNIMVDRGAGDTRLSEQLRQSHGSHRMDGERHHIMGEYHIRTEAFDYLHQFLFHFPAGGIKGFSKLILSREVDYLLPEQVTHHLRHCFRVELQSRYRVVRPGVSRAYRYLVSHNFHEVPAFHQLK